MDAAVTHLCPVYRQTAADLQARARICAWIAAPL
jgi:hypothetical protein